MEIEEENPKTTIKNQRLNINFTELLNDNDIQPVKLTIVPANSRRRKPPNPSGCPGDEERDSLLSESDLKPKIYRIEKSIRLLSGKLPDYGAKLKDQLRNLKDELNRRQIREVSVETTSNCGLKVPECALNGSKHKLSSQGSSLFGISLLNKLDNDNPKLEHNTTNLASDAFDSEISFMNRNEKSKRKSNGQLPQCKKVNPWLCSKGFFKRRQGDNSPRKGRKCMQLNGKLAGRVSSKCSLPLLRVKSVDSFTDDDDSQALDSNGLKNEKQDQTVVLEDEGEPKHIKRKREAKKLPSRLSEDKIYYPSREDPESLEILRSELKCLEPGECLTSTIMNFYVRYLQEHCLDSLQFNFYFFNTYFYSKLKETLKYQKHDWEDLFLKFRRWWKGVNIFQKEYIFVPINEENHWSLVIICIPVEECESGPIILHLDSLGLHSSDSICGNIKSLLRNEWKILNKDIGSVNVPLPERIWKDLPNRIEHKSIEVPRQTNQYDCGPFVLYYMECFIKDASESLMNQGYLKFGRNWFKPEEASRLRGEIKTILLEKFDDFLQQDNSISKPTFSPSKDEIAKTIDRAEIC